MMSGPPRRRFTETTVTEPGSYRLADYHPAVTAGRTLFPGTVVAADDSPRVLVSGANQRKLGDRVAKGPWRGMPIYCLTLEERKTCPQTCHRWADCYGNGMPKSRRIEAGPALEAALHNELTVLAHKHREGFVVRLHILGDFYSVAYVERWRVWLLRFPMMRVFGYTARPRDTDIGEAIAALTEQHWDQFAIRFSSREPGPGRAITLPHLPGSAPDPVIETTARMPQRAAATTLGISLGELQRRLRRAIPLADEAMPEVTKDTIVCPAQTGATDSCGTCGLCWSPAAKGKAIAFLLHGARGPYSRQARVVPQAAEIESVNNAIIIRSSSDPDPSMIDRLAADPALRRLALLEQAMLEGRPLSEAFDLAQKIEAWIGNTPATRTGIVPILQPSTANKRITNAQPAGEPSSSLLNRDDLAKAIEMYRGGARNREVAAVFNLDLRQVQGMRMGLHRGRHI